MKTGKEGKNTTKNSIEKVFRLIFTGIIVLSVITAILLIAPNVRLFRTYVATVGNEKVTQEEYEFFLNQAKADIFSKADPEDESVFWGTVLKDNKTAFEVAKEQALENVKELKVQVIKAKERGLKLDRDQVKEFNKSVDEQARVYGDDFFKQIYGAAPADFKDIYKQYMLAGKLSQEEIKTIELKDEEVQEYYEKNKDALDRVTVRHILFKVNAEDDESKKAEVKKKAEDILAKVKAGEDIGELAKQNSEDEGTKDKGGEYTVAPDDNTVSEFKTWVYENKVGDVGIVETQYGYHVIKIDKRTTYEEVKEDARNMALDDKYQTLKVGEWIKDPQFDVKILAAYNKITQ